VKEARKEKNEIANNTNLTRGTLSEMTKEQILNSIGISRSERKRAIFGPSCRVTFHCLPLSVAVYYIAYYAACSGICDASCSVDSAIFYIPFATSDTYGLFRFQTCAFKVVLFPALSVISKVRLRSFGSAKNLPSHLTWPRQSRLS
jgi:hypothetical protein